MTPATMAPGEPSTEHAATEHAATEHAATEHAATEALARLRGEIETVDAQLVALIAERVRLAGAIGAAKRQLGRPTLDPRREAAVVRRAGELARRHGLDDEAVRVVFWELMALARREQEAPER